jgi:hypothetical protein
MRCESHVLFLVTIPVTTCRAAGAAVCGSQAVQITVQTSDVSGAGTDANVWIVMHGEDGTTTDKLTLDKKGRNCFERNQKDEFTVRPWRWREGTIRYPTLSSHTHVCMFLFKPHWRLCIATNLSWALE